MATGVKPSRDLAIIAKLFNEGLAPTPQERKLTAAQIGDDALVGKALLEVPFEGRTRGAFQLVGSPTATLIVEGTLAPSTATRDKDEEIAFYEKLADADYAQIASVTAAGITQIDGRYTRVRVRLAAHTAGNFTIRLI